MRLLPIFTLLTTFLAIAAQLSSKPDIEDSDDINMLLGMRPDLAEDLAPDSSSENDGNRASTLPGASENAAVKNNNDQLECVSGCKVTDQSCRARCLGVPGGASRKMPRKQDISGNLPLNWRVAKDEPVSAKKGLDVADSNNAARIPAMGYISMVLLLLVAHVSNANLA